jgi:hypothetical protein
MNHACRLRGSSAAAMAMPDLRGIIVAIDGWTSAAATRASRCKRTAARWTTPATSDGDQAPEDEVVRVVDDAHGAGTDTAIDAKLPVQNARNVRGDRGCGR